MCRSSAEPGGPRRCSSDTHGKFSHAAGTVAQLKRLETALEASTTYGCTATAFALELPTGVKAALDPARNAGTPLIVGGAVRDATLGVAPKDFDIEVHRADLDDLVRCYRQAGFQVDEVGRQFGVLKVSKPGLVTDLDVSVPRRDSKTGAGHRGFSIALERGMSVTEAAARRDFTVNALLYDPQRRIVLDPFGGADDLRTGTLRHVSEQFSEDPLRVLRGVQLAGRFGMVLHPDTAALCRRLRPHFDELAVERISEEWAKLYTKSRHPSSALRALHDSGWDDTLPGLAASLRNPAIQRAFGSLHTVSDQDRVTVGAAILSSAMSSHDRERFLHHTVVGSDNARIAADLAVSTARELDTSYARKRHADRLSKRGFTFDRYLIYANLMGDRAATQVARAAISEGIGAGPEAPLIQGRDIIATVSGGRKPGPWVGDLVTAALDRQYRGEFHSRTEALAWLRTHAQLAP